MPNVSLDEKRLEALRRQLQVKTSLSPTPKETVATKSHSTTTTPTREITLESTGYLKKDLTKILIMASLAIIFQLALFFSMTSHILNFNI